MNIIYICSREWSKSILMGLLNLKTEDWRISLVLYTKEIELSLPKNINSILLKDNNIDNYLNVISSYYPSTILAYGWSHYLSKEIRSIAPCLVLHPSKLPEYRGGSPIQNQLMNGVTKSAVTILLAVDDVDKGGIFFQKEIDFTGYLDDILHRMAVTGIDATLEILNNLPLNLTQIGPQDEKMATYVSRRTPEMSQIKVQQFNDYEAEYFYNMVRGLQNPYPESYIVCKNNTKLYITKVHL
jgi:methionyl-tRNA formyltransferase